MKRLLMSVIRWWVLVRMQELGLLLMKLLTVTLALLFGPAVVSGLVLNRIQMLLGALLLMVGMETETVQKKKVQPSLFQNVRREQVVLSTGTSLVPNVNLGGWCGCGDGGKGGGICSDDCDV